MGSLPIHSALYRAVPNVAEFENKEIDRLHAITVFEPPKLSGPQWMSSYI